MPRKRRGKQYRLLELKPLEKLLSTIEDCLKQIDTIDLSKTQSIAKVPGIVATLGHATDKYKREHLKE